MLRVDKRQRKAALKPTSAKGVKCKKIFGQLVTKCLSLVSTGVEIRHVVCSARKSSALQLKAVQYRAV